MEGRILRVRRGSGERRLRWNNVNSAAEASCEVERLVIVGKSEDTARRVKNANGSPRSSKADSAVENGCGSAVEECGRVECGSLAAGCVSGS